MSQHYAPAPVRAIAAGAYLGLLAGAVVWVALALPVYAAQAAWKARAALVLLLLQACAQPYETPPLPVALYISPELDAERADEWRNSARRYNEALGVTVFVETDKPGKCGVRVVDDDGIGESRGMTTPLDQCLMKVRFNAKLERERWPSTSAHELAHTLELEMHNEDDQSVLRYSTKVGAVITLDDIEFLRDVLPASMMRGAISKPESWPYKAAQ